MPHSSPTGHRYAVLTLLLLANGGLLSVWPWLHARPLGADAGESLVVLHRGTERPNTPAILRNETYFQWAADLIRKDEGVLFFGTSETGPAYNLGAQLNVVIPQDPRMFVLYRSGMSPIHSALFFAKCAVAETELPPMVLVINPIYFTNSHDVINDGWMGSAIRSPAFYLMNHNNLRSHLSPEVCRLYDSHFRTSATLTPMWLEEYLSNLLYLHFHQDPSDSRKPQHLPLPSYSYEGVRPSYDQERNVHSGYHSSDELAKGRWLVKAPKDCINLAGLASTMPILHRQGVPILVLILPPNRRYYAFYGLDMELYDENYAGLRDEITRIVSGDNVHVIDLFEGMELDLGFADRMHMDAFGYWQTAQFLSGFAPYRDFVEDVRGYYDRHTTPTQP